MLGEAENPGHRTRGRGERMNEHRVSLPSEHASRDELWAWIETHVPLIETLNQVSGDSEIVSCEVGFTPKEHELFTLLHMRAGQIVSRQQATDFLYALRPGDAACDQIINVMICKMRAKLADTGFKIETVWGRGYILRLP